MTGRHAAARRIGRKFRIGIDAHLVGIVVIQDNFIEPTVQVVFGVVEFSDVFSPRPAGSTTSLSWFPRLPGAGGTLLGMIRRAIIGTRLAFGPSSATTAAATPPSPPSRLAVLVQRLFRALISLTLALTCIREGRILRVLPPRIHVVRVVRTAVDTSFFMSTTMPNVPLFSRLVVP